MDVSRKAPADKPSVYVNWRLTK